MSMEHNKPFRHTFGFRFRDNPPFQLAQVSGVGWEHIDSSIEYDWDGMKRVASGGPSGLILFQYTLSGQGAIRIEDITYELTPGKAFLVWIPSNHHYYFPKDADHWEYLYLTLSGDNLRPVYEELAHRLGNIAQFSPDSDVIRNLKAIFEKAKLRQITDSHLSAAYAYRFIMEMTRSSVYGNSKSEIPDYINRTIDYIEINYSTLGSLLEMADVAGLSKYHFLRQFHKFIGMTPLEYLNKLRIEKAAELLRTTEKTLEEVAQTVGFANGNYFSKVFRHWVGMSPGKFRSERGLTSADHIYLK